MNRNKAKAILLLIVVVSLGFLPGDSTSADPGPADSGSISAPAVTLRAASGATAAFQTNNGVMADGVAFQARDVPHLVLRRNGALTDPAERTLIVEVAGLEVPSPGVTVTLAIETQRGDPDVADTPSPRIQVWRQSRWIANATGAPRTGVSIVWHHEFTASVQSGARELGTPTDYLRYDLAVTAGRRPATGPLYTFSQDYALLLENQWIAPLPAVQEASPGAAPDELVVYYSDMIPFRRDGRDASTWLPRDRISDYLSSELIPAMVQAFRIQTDDWGFPWFPEWTGHRPGRDTEQLSVALADGQAWFHGQTLGQGNA
ncbi:MAG: hypothetical protein ACK2UY_00870, partial [Anaerolineae bacterium]